MGSLQPQQENEIYQELIFSIIVPALQKDFTYAKLDEIWKSAIHDVGVGLGDWQ
jgi:hypothetical protein